jgi:hypothetical protein
MYQYNVNEDVLDQWSVMMCQAMPVPPRGQVSMRPVCVSAKPCDTDVQLRQLNRLGFDAASF